MFPCRESGYRRSSLAGASAGTNRLGYTISLDAHRQAPYLSIIVIFSKFLDKVLRYRIKAKHIHQLRQCIIPW